MAPIFLDELPIAIASADNLPSIPGVAVEILRLSRDEEAGLDDYADAITLDPALSAKLLKHSNSSLFSMSHEVTNLRQATMVLGMKTIQLMSLSFSLTKGIAEKQTDGVFDFDEYWSRSLIAGVAGRGFCRLFNLSFGDEAFMCGLLSNIGQLVMNQCIPDNYAEVLEKCDHWPTNEDEEAILGYSHSALGGVLLKNWELPDLICDVIGNLHDPSGLPADSLEPTRELVEIMHLATHVVSVLRDEDKGDSLSKLLEATGERGLPPEEVTAFLVSLESDVKETAGLFDLTVKSREDHADIVDAARQQMMAISLGTAATLQQTERREAHLRTENRVLAQQASTDKLTGIANRAGFDAVMEKEVASRTGQERSNSMGLLIIDVDKFKNFNDVHGHQAGDEVLKVVGRILSKLTRESDLSARYGGEEFAIVVAQTTPFALKCYADRVRTEIASTQLPIGEEILSITVSIGGVCMERATDVQSTIPAMIKIADDHLYQCKENGRNCCSIQPDPMAFG
ncbi:MAG: two-component system cell cycle response regulator [Planctomycetota bacterium]|jgi:two-component system cell cycle response regulator